MSQIFLPDPFKKVTEKLLGVVVSENPLYNMK